MNIYPTLEKHRKVLIKLLKVFYLTSRVLLFILRNRNRLNVQTMQFAILSIREVMYLRKANGG